MARLSEDFETLVIFLRRHRTRIQWNDAK